MKKKRKKDIALELEKRDFRVTIFGSARIKNNTEKYNRIELLAEKLGERGIDIVTGGGPGLMRAAGQGHKKGRKKSKIKSHSIGLAIRLQHEQKVNKYVDVVKKFERFSNRIDNFMLLSNVVVVAPGGIGTVLEFFYTWQLIQVKKICNIPIILLGDEWPELIKWLEKYPLKRKYFDKKDLGLIFHAKNIKEVLKMIDKAHEEYKKGGKNYCLNYKKYKLY